MACGPNFQKINELRRQKRDTGPNRSFKKDRSDGRSRKVKHTDATHNAPGTDMQQPTQGDVQSAGQTHSQTNEIAHDVPDSAQQQPPQQQHKKKSKQQDRDRAADKRRPCSTAHAELCKADTEARQRWEDEDHKAARSFIAC